MARGRAQMTLMIRYRFASLVLLAAALLMLVVLVVGVKGETTRSLMDNSTGGEKKKEEEEKSSKKISNITREPNSSEPCSCKDSVESDLKCPKDEYTFDSKSIEQEGKSALWALECFSNVNVSDGVSETPACSKSCRKQIEKVYGKKAYCTCVNKSALDQLAKQSFTLLAMHPNQILNACFSEDCSYNFTLDQ